MEVTQEKLDALQRVLDAQSAFFDAISELERLMGFDPIENNLFAEIDAADAAALDLIEKDHEQWLESLRRRHCAPAHNG